MKIIGNFTDLKLLAKQIFKRTVRLYIDKNATDQTNVYSLIAGLKLYFYEIFSFIPNQRNEHKNRDWRNGSVECEYDKGCRGRPMPHTTYTVRLKLHSDRRAKGERALSLSLGLPSHSYTIFLRLLFFLLCHTSLMATTASFFLSLSLTKFPFPVFPCRFDHGGRRTKKW